MITAFLPCRAGSERIPNKNTKDFAGIKGGLLKIKIEQLVEVKLIDKLLISTNDTQVIKIAQSFKNKKIIIDKRPEHLTLSSTSTDEVINYVPNIINAGHVVWTHVTSPFFNTDNYTSAIQEYLSGIENKTHDSLMSVNKIQNFLWGENGSFNYDSKIEKWPRTQTLNKLYEINSGVFINSIENYVKYQNRIGNSPKYFESPGLSSFDIDWPDDFTLGELIFKSLNK
ncbi:cytidylyltransferase domain-containing protein [Cellulophaga sp. L1A9]|uniref:acylneuraminate cytidylyltransferase family protein n=1 Tax=Cellulophaga sp. L1A9 TaxID=2686362 RepID=UPI00131C4630|nr:acylneuraminate cytidylyltransferase family protein [Cellulophaga sp. L1A9]